MGTEYKRNWKNLVGRPDIVGHDVVDLGVTGLQAAIVPTPLADRLGSTRHELGSDARLEGVSLALSSGALTLGRVGVEVMLDGAPVASGALYAGGPGAKFIKLDKQTLSDIPCASGQVLTVNYTVEESFDTVQALRASLSIALLEFPER